jgi:hypothetical protein
MVKWGVFIEPRWQNSVHPHAALALVKRIGGNFKSLLNQLNSMPVFPFFKDPSLLSSMTDALHARTKLACHGGPVNPRS